MTLCWCTIPPCWLTFTIISLSPFLSFPLALCLCSSQLMFLSQQHKFLQAHPPHHRPIAPHCAHLPFIADLVPQGSHCLSPPLPHTSTDMWGLVFPFVSLSCASFLVLNSRFTLIRLVLYWFTTIIFPLSQTLVFSLVTVLLPFPPFLLSFPFHASDSIASIWFLDVLYSTLQ